MLHNNHDRWVCHDTGHLHVNQLLTVSYLSYLDAAAPVMKTILRMTMSAWGTPALPILPGNLALCPDEIVEMDVMTPTDAELLTSALQCYGKGVFSITWVGSVVVTQSIVVSGGSSLTVTGSRWESSSQGDHSGTEEGSTIDGGGCHRII